MMTSFTRFQSLYVIISMLRLSLLVLRNVWGRDNRALVCYSYIAVSAFFEKLAKLLVSGMNGRLLQAYFGRHYSSPTFQSSSPVPRYSQIIQSHVTVPCSSGESSPAIRDTRGLPGIVTSTGSLFWVSPQ